MSNEHIQCHAIRSQNSHPRFLKIKDAVANENDMILKTPTEEHFCSSKNTPKQIKAQLKRDWQREVESDPILAAANSQRKKLTKEIKTVEVTRENFLMR